MARRILLLFFLLLFLISPALQAERTYPFLGEIDTQKKNVTLIFPSDDSKSQSLIVNELQKDIYQILIDVANIKNLPFDINTKLEITIKIQRDDKENISALIGTINSKYALVDNKPVNDMKGRFAFKDGELIIHSLSFDKVLLKGEVQLAKPFQIDLTLQLFDLNMESFLAFFNGHRRIKSSGTVDGVVKIGGTVNQLSLKGDLFSYNAYVDKLNYHSINLKAQGTFPVINLEDTVITKSDGLPFKVLGTIDLLDKKNFKKQIASLARKPVVIDDKHNLEWTFRRIESDDESGTTELKYLRRKENDIRSLSEDKGDMLGIERILEF